MGVLLVVSAAFDALDFARYQHRLQMGVSSEKEATMFEFALAVLLGVAIGYGIRDYISRKWSADQRLRRDASRAF